MCMYVYMCVHVRVCMCVCVYIYIYIYTHIYIWLKLFGPGSSSQSVHHKCLLFILFIDFSTEYIYFPVVSIPVPSQELNR